jgi:hypothetical protein
MPTHVRRRTTPWEIALAARCRPIAGAEHRRFA